MSVHSAGKIELLIVSSVILLTVPNSDIPACDKKLSPCADSSSVAFVEIILTTLPVVVNDTPVLFAAVSASLICCTAFVIVVLTCTSSSTASFVNAVPIIDAAIFPATTIVDLLPPLSLVNFNKVPEADAVIWGNSITALI